MPMPLPSRRRLPTFPRRARFRQRQPPASTNSRSIPIRRCGGAPSWRSAASACWMVCRISCRRFRILTLQVRAMAAFAIGLIGPDARDGARPLRAALEDPSPIVRARAVEGLGLVGDAASAPAIVTAAAGCDARMASIAPDDEEAPKAPEIEICRLALFALARLRDYERLAQVALTPEGQPVSRWWPVAYALQRIGDPRATPALLLLATTPGSTPPGLPFAVSARSRTGRRCHSPRRRRSIPTPT